MGLRVTLQPGASGLRRLRATWRELNLAPRSRTPPRSGTPVERGQEYGFVATGAQGAALVVREETGIQRSNDFSATNNP
jgi:hypothetical protein